MLRRPPVALLLILLLTGCPGKSAPSGKGGGNAMASADNAPVPILAAQAVQRDVPIRLSAVGRVEAFETVSVKAQVAGQINAIHFHEGQEVHKGDLLFTLDARPYEATLHREEANLARDEVDARNAEKEHQRYSDLNRRKVVATDQYDTARATAESKAAQVQADRATVEMARLQAEYCRIVSPVDGVAGEVKTHAGNIVKANDTELVVVNRIRPALVSFSVPENELGTISQAMLAGPVRVSVIFPDGKDPVATGTLVFINNQVDPQTGTIRLKASFENAEKQLWPGQYVNVSLVAGVVPAAVEVPAEAVQTSQSGPSVFVVKGDGGVDNRPVTVGRTEDGLTVIERGVSPGEQVVTDGHLRLRPGCKVEVRRTLDSAETK
jgi:multidrug efflux system membrane fusion protein